MKMLLVIFQIQLLEVKLLNSHTFTLITKLKSSYVFLAGVNKVQNINIGL